MSLAPSPAARWGALRVTAALLLLALLLLGTGPLLDRLLPPASGTVATLLPDDAPDDDRPGPLLRPAPVAEPAPARDVTPATPARPVPLRLAVAAAGSPPPQTGPPSAS